MDFSGNSSGNLSASWHPEPTTRGSFTILSSCFITLLLCVWKVVHLNLPEHKNCLPDRTKLDPRYWIVPQTWRKVGWLLLGLLAPEMVAFTAWSQRKEAQVFKDMMNKNLPGTQRLADDDIEAAHPDQEVTSDHLWTTMHGFHAIMGGFVIDTSALSGQEKFLPGNRERLTLTTAGLKFLAQQRPDLIPLVPIEEIQDKSKADTFAKSIIAVQASFFIIQCIYRLVQQLSISLLELNTLAHTLCALLSYMFWWRKPLGVAEPTPISADRYMELWAALCYRSEICKGRTRDSTYFTSDIHSAQTTSRLEDSSAELLLYGGETFGNLQCNLEHTEYRTCTTRDKRRWSLAGFCIIDHGWHNVRLESHIRNAPAELPFDTLSDRTTNWPSNFTLSVLEEPTLKKDSRQLLAAFTLAGLSYGALHLLAWTFQFNSHTEHLLWQIAGVTIATSGPAFLAIQLLVAFFFWVDDHPQYSNVADIVKFVVWFLLGAYGLLYLFSRVYLIVEALISFAYLPDAAFQQPQWTYYFPHIG